MWRASVITLFPELFPGPLGASLAGKAHGKGLWALDAVDLRGYATDKHRTVDDTPAGGGPGMVMKADVLARAIDAVTGESHPAFPSPERGGSDRDQRSGEGSQPGPRPPPGEQQLADLPLLGGGFSAPPAGSGLRPRLLMSARGAPFTQARAAQLAAGPGLVIVCGRFEGVDERAIEARGLEEVSIGDYVLSGGELAAMVLIDACVRLIPGVMGKEASAAEESFAQHLLEYPHYTKPQSWEGRAIPEVLVSGDHAKVAAWRRAEAERLTRARRPDLWAAYLALAGVKATEG